jgi:hypothetical protein
MIAAEANATRLDNSQLWAGEASRDAEAQASRDRIYELAKHMAMWIQALATHWKIIVDPGLFDGTLRAQARAGALRSEQLQQQQQQQQQQQDRKPSTELPQDEDADD